MNIPTPTSIFLPFNVESRQIERGQATLPDLHYRRLSCSSAACVSLLLYVEHTTDTLNAVYLSALDSIRYHALPFSGQQPSTL
jgi:hypothetical protein